MHLEGGGDGPHAPIAAKLMIPDLQTDSKPSPFGISFLLQVSEFFGSIFCLKRN